VNVVVMMPVTFSDHSTDNMGISTISNHVPATLHHDERGEPSAAADKSKSSWKSTASATTKLLLRGVRDTADAFGPLKSVAGGLCFILENCEVQSPSYIWYLVLTDTLANGGEYTSDRIAGSPNQSARRIALRDYF